MTVKTDKNDLAMFLHQTLRLDDRSIWFDHTTVGYFEDMNQTVRDDLDLGYENMLGLNVRKKIPTGASGLSYVVTDSKGDITHELVNYYPSEYIRAVNLGHIPLPGFTETTSPYWGGGYATELAAETNPSRPEVSLPAFIGELKDIPSQIYDKGAKSLKDFTKSGPQTDSVGIQFGILPLVSDILKMTRLSESIDKRVVELNNLAGKGGARVSRILSQPPGAHQVIDCPKGFDPWDGNLKGSIDIKTRGTIRGVMRWLPQVSGNVDFPPGKIQRSHVRDLLLGIDSQKSAVSYLADVWELVPWSWFADWFGNLGDYLKANSNSAIATPGDCWIMQQQETVIKGDFGEGGSVSHYLVSKQRVLAVPSLRVTMPVLSHGQMSILIGLSRSAGRDITKIRDFRNLNI